MLTVEYLRKFGAAVDEGLGRCMNNEPIYLRLVKTALNDANFEKLETALSAGDLEAGFAAAHALKGVLGNLSLTPMYVLAGEMTELLRARTQRDYAPMLQKLLALRQELLSQTK